MADPPNQQQQRGQGGGRGGGGGGQNQPRAPRMSCASLKAILRNVPEAEMTPDMKSSTVEHLATCQQCQEEFLPLIQKSVKGGSATAQPGEGNTQAAPKEKSFWEKLGEKGKENFTKGRSFWRRG